MVCSIPENFFSLKLEKKIGQHCLKFEPTLTLLGTLRSCALS
ncbi:hypothetical protein HMPREF9554_00250 [Treponema phagedenis F0421]|nr:hypothetical protein HMPREF9554_00250 [Treponema phagedenis F0421]